jgi:hypothetical protein
VALTPAPAEGFVGWSGGGCDGHGRNPCVILLTADITRVVARFCDTAPIVVDAVNGDDGSSGTCAEPFATLGKGLAAAAAGQTVQVRPGAYRAPGESFPLIVPDGVTLIGDEMQKGAGPAPVSIEGGGPVDGSPGLRAALVLGTGSVAAGLRVSNVASVAGSHGVVITRPSPGSADGAVLRNCTVTGSSTDGVYLERARSAIVVGNVVTAQDDGGTGIRITADAPGALLERNFVVGNTYGVEINADADLGGGARNSAGQNVFSCNVEIDVLAVGGAAPIRVDAEDNLWDHAPPESSTGCASNLDLCESNATVPTAGARLAPNPCD